MTTREMVNMARLGMAAMAAAGAIGTREAIPATRLPEWPPKDWARPEPSLPANVTRIDLKREIAADLNRLEMKPLQWVLWAYPWGEPGSPLENETGPDLWQRRWLANIGDRLEDEPYEVIREALASGHGIGKTTCLTWLIQWATTTYPLMRGVVTANTDSQLKSKTWAEMHKWWGMVNPILRDEFVLTATAFYSADKRYEKNWRIDAVPWSEKNPAAFAGLHNAGKRILIVMDEGSEISDKIYEVVEGATTDINTQIIWAVFGNPTRNQGYFKRIIAGDLRGMWGHKQIDSRDVSRTSKKLFDDWAAAYGDDSDFFRVRVKGQFPRASSLQFIAEDVVDAAMKLAAPGYNASDPLVYGLDVARHGDDSSVLCKRQGRDAKSRPWKKWRIPDLMQLAQFVAAECKVEPPDALFIDVSGIGWGVYDKLRELKLGFPIYPINFGDAGGETYINNVSVRCAYQVDRIWTEMREWLKGGAIPDDDELKQDLIGREYGIDRNSAIRLEQKDHMKSRGLASPDNADALALTFTYPVGPKKVLGDLTRALVANRTGVGDNGQDIDVNDVYRDVTRDSAHVLRARHPQAAQGTPRREARDGRGDRRRRQPQHGPGRRDPHQPHRTGRGPDHGRQVPAGSLTWRTPSLSRPSSMRLRA